MLVLVGGLSVMADQTNVAYRGPTFNHTRQDVGLMSYRLNEEFLLKQRDMWQHRAVSMSNSLAAVLQENAELKAKASAALPALASTQAMPADAINPAIAGVPTVTNSCGLIVTNNVQTYAGSTFAPPFSVYWASAAAGPYSKMLTVAQGATNWTQTVLFTTHNRFFYTTNGP